MSKVKIEGNASGTGTLTISAPNTDTDRTLTLPDTAGEFVTADASGLLELSSGSPKIKLTDTDNTIGQTGLVANISAEDSAGTATWVIGREFGSTALKILNKQASSTIFETDGSERMRIDSSGNVGIGTDSPDELLHIYGTDCAIKFDDQQGSPTDQSLILRHEPVNNDLPGTISSGLMVERSSTNAESGTDIDSGICAKNFGFSQNNTSLSGIISGSIGEISTGNSASSYSSEEQGGVTNYVTTHTVTTGKTFGSTPEYFITLLGNNTSGHTSITNTYIKDPSTTSFVVVVADRVGSSGIYINWLGLNTA